MTKKTLCEKMVGFVALAGFILGMGVTASAQGTLEPPGAPAPGMKTLDQIEPRIPISALPITIEAPGSYYFTDNLDAPQSTRGTPAPGITIATDDVTIDLMGFRLRGQPDIWLFDPITGTSNKTHTGSTSGIVTSGTINNVTLRNGFVSGTFSERGIDLRADGSGTGMLLQDIQVSGAASDGIRVGRYAVIENCIARDNGRDGIRASGRAVIRASGAHHNGRNGIYTGTGGSINNAVSYNNGLQGIYGGANVTVTGCSVHDNGDNGIMVGWNNTVINVSARGNGGHGISGGVNSVIKGCASYDNDQYGIHVGSSSVVRDTAANGNAGSGILVGNGSSIVNCSSAWNKEHGFYVWHYSTVLNNNAARNADGDADIAGIMVAGNDNRIEGNHSVDNGKWGILVSGANNFIARNTCRDNNVNYAIAADNVGLVVPATTSAAFTGNSGGVSPGSSNPNANYAY